MQERKEKLHNLESDNLNEIKQIIFGSLLGDGKLELAPRAVNARFGFIQAEFREEYFISVFNSLKALHNGKYRKYSYLDNRTGKIYKSLNFWTKANPILNELYNKFYWKKLKKIPLDLTLLTPLAIAHWVMQDGSRGTSKGLYLCSDGFTYLDVERITDYLTSKYNIKCSIHKAGKNFRIYILVKSIDRVKDLLKPYMHKSMLYKLGV